MSETEAVMQSGLGDLCHEQGLTTAALAERTGLDERRVTAILEGRWTPSPGERDKIAAVFGLTRDEIAWGHKTSVQHLYGHGPQFGRTP
jgi:transcriptional regulator with XRE-family HTH domain